LVADSARSRLLPACGKLALAGLATVLLLEGLVRGVLFHGWLAGVAALDVLRKPTSYADPIEDEYWQLRLLLGRAPRIDAERIDRELGWVPAMVRPGVYDHADRARLRDRRPVLLFGDSYAAGMTPRPARFQSLLGRSPAAERLVLVNYGCPGYGFDQTLLLMRRALELWSDLDPLVLVGVLVDEDFERALLEVRALPKPRLVPRDGGLALERLAVPPVEDYLAEAVPWWRPWSWRLLLDGEASPAWLTARRQERLERRRESLARALLETTVAELEARGLAFGFVLFHTRQALAEPPRPSWSEPLAIETLERRGVPYVLSRASLARDALASGRPAGRYFYSSGMQLNHLNRAGNRAVFEGMLALIEELERLRGWHPAVAQKLQAVSEQ